MTIADVLESRGYDLRDQIFDPGWNPFISLSSDMPSEGISISEQICTDFYGHPFLMLCVSTVLDEIHCSFCVSLPACQSQRAKRDGVVQHFRPIYCE